MRKYPDHYQECMSLSSWDTGVTLHIAILHHSKDIKDCQHFTIPSNFESNQNHLCYDAEL